MQPATKRAIPKKPTTTTPVKQSKPAPSPTKKPSKQDEAQQESNPQGEDDDPDLELAKKSSLETPQEKGEGECDDACNTPKLGRSGIRVRGVLLQDQ
ncbi:hypothetical protein Tco_0476732 [Tanacetum coccineum]